MKTVYVVIAYDATAYRLTRVFSTEEKAQAFKVTLKELCWQKITIDRCYVDEQQHNRMPDKSYEFEEIIDHLKFLGITEK